MISQEVNFLQPHLVPGQKYYGWRWAGVGVVVMILAGFFYGQQSRVWRLEEEVRTLQQEVEKRALPKGGTTFIPLIDNGFYKYFNAFAQSVGEGVWLTRMTVREEGRRVVLEGRALASESPWGVMERLNGHPLFASGWRFGSLTVTPLSDPDAGYSFLLAGERR